MNLHNLDIINPVYCRQWNELLLSAEDHSIFHTANWARVLSEAYGFTPLYFSSFTGDKLSALVPVMEVKSFLTGCRGVSLPFSDFCQPVLPDEAGGKAFTRHIAKYGRSAGWEFLELRGDHGQPANTPGYRHYYTHKIDLSPGEELIYKNLRSSTRRNIAKAVRDGVSVKSGTSLEFVDTFYRLNCLTRKQHGVPPQPYTFFGKLYEHIFSQGMGTIFLADYNGSCIAGIVLLHFGTGVLYKFGASNTEYSHLRANNYVMWEAIRTSCRKGFLQFSFGRTEPENHGLRQFKNGWSAEEQSIQYFRYNIRNEQYVAAGNADCTSCYAPLISRLPLPLLKLTGKCLYRHMG